MRHLTLVGVMAAWFFAGAARAQTPPPFEAVPGQALGGAVYAIEAGDFDASADGPEFAVLLEDGGVFIVNPEAMNVAAPIHPGEEAIPGMHTRPTLSAGSIPSRSDRPTLTVTGVNLVTLLYRGGDAWVSERVEDYSEFIGMHWGTRVGDLDPDNPGDELFHIFEGVFDFSSGYLFRPENGDWSDQIIYSGEVGMDSAIGDFNPEHPGNELVVTTEMGPTYEILVPDDPSAEGEWPKRTIWDNFEDAGWVVEIADVDPDRPGNEIVYGTRYSNAVAVSSHNGDQPHHWEKVFTGNVAGDDPANMVDIAVGDAWPENPGLEILGVDSTGSVYMVWRTDEGWQGAAIWTDPAGALNAVECADFDPSSPGGEIAVGGDGGTPVLLRAAASSAVDHWDHMR